MGLRREKEERERDEWASDAWREGRKRLEDRERGMDEVRGR